MSKVACLRTLCALALVFVVGCGGGAGGGGGSTGTLAISLTDAPFPATENCLAEARIEISSVEAKGDAGFVTVGLVQPDPDPDPDNDNVFLDLLDLRAGLTAALALGEVPTGSYSEVRLHIESAQLIFTDGSTPQDFKIPSGMSSGLKLKISPPLLVTEGETAKLMFDVDLAESFHTTGLGNSPTCDDLKAGETTVIFSPTVRIVNLDESALVLGVVSDAAGDPVGDVEVTAFIAGTVVDADSIAEVSTFSSPAGNPEVTQGSYAISLEPGTYDLYVRAQEADDRTIALTDLTVGAGEIATGQDLTIP